MIDLVAIHSLDDDQIRQLHALYQNEWWSRGRSLEETRRVVAGSSLVVALWDAGRGRLAGFARALTDGVFKAMIFDVIVARDYRERGLGRRLMDLIAAHPALGSAKHLELYCLPEMIPFYQRWGFSDQVGNVLLMRRSRG